MQNLLPIIYRCLVPDTPIMPDTTVKHYVNFLKFINLPCSRTEGYIGAPNFKTLGMYVLTMPINSFGETGFETNLSILIEGSTFEKS